MKGFVAKPVSSVKLLFAGEMVVLKEVNQVKWFIAQPVSSVEWLFAKVKLI